MADACKEKGLDVHTVVETLKAVEEAAGTGTEGRDGKADRADWTRASLTELCDHIEWTHHQYLYQEMPRIAAHIDRVVQAHGQRHPSLHEVRRFYTALSEKLASHLMKDERILFPAIRQLDAAGGQAGLQFGSVATRSARWRSSMTRLVKHWPGSGR